MDSFETRCSTETESKYLDKLYEDLGFVGQGLIILFLWKAAYFVVENLDFPGNPNGKLWPIYIPEHYGERTSQHLLDPYRYVCRKI